jgi:chemotaxis signal transduction protein
MTTTTLPPSQASPSASNPATNPSVAMPKTGIAEAARRFLSVYLKPSGPSQLPAVPQAILPTDSLIEVLTLTLGQIITIPDMPAAVIGVCNWRGEVLWLVDTGYLLHDRPSFVDADYQTKFSVVVLQRQNRALGLVVDRVGNMVWCHDTELQRLDEPTRSANPDRAQLLLGQWQPSVGSGSGSNPDRSLYAFDPEAILARFAA